MVQLKDIVKIMNINLGKENSEVIKSFSYSINETYEPYIAGKGITTGATNSTLASFIGKTRDEAQNYCDKNDLNCSFSYVDSQSDKYNASVDTDLIGSQNPPAGTLLRGVSSPHFYINGEVLND